MVKETSADETYLYWYDLYHLLATLPLDDPNIRSSDRIIEILRDAHWGVNFEVLENYWERIRWTASNCKGKVLEIGSGMGNVSRWIAANDEVTGVLCIDLQESYINALKSFGFNKIKAHCIDVTDDSEIIASEAPFDVVVMSEVIEHMTFRQEFRIIRKVAPLIKPGGRWIITTPIGYMEDPDHCRGFRPFLFKLRSRIIYGRPVEFHDNTIQQFALIEHRSAGGSFYFRKYAAEILDALFMTRKSGQPWLCVSLLLRWPRKALRWVKLIRGRKEGR